MASIWRTRDYRGRAVALTEAAWAHIPSRHPEMADRFDEIRLTIEAPISSVETNRSQTVKCCTAGTHPIELG